MNTETAQRIAEIRSWKGYKFQPRRETLDDYARRIAGSLHQGWAFFKGENRREWFESEVALIREHIASTL